MTEEKKSKAPVAAAAAPKKSVPSAGGKEAASEEEKKTKKRRVAERRLLPTKSVKSLLKQTGWSSTRVRDSTQVFLETVYSELATEILTVARDLAVAQGLARAQVRHVETAISIVLRRSQSIGDESAGAEKGLIETTMLGGGRKAMAAYQAAHKEEMKRERKPRATPFAPKVRVKGSGTGSTILIPARLVNDYMRPEKASDFASSAGAPAKPQSDKTVTVGWTAFRAKANLSLAPSRLAALAEKVGGKLSTFARSSIVYLSGAMDELLCYIVEGAVLAHSDDTSAGLSYALIESSLFTRRRAKEAGKGSGGMSTAVLDSDLLQLLLPYMPLTPQLRDYYTLVPMSIPVAMRSSLRSIKTADKGKKKKKKAKAAPAADETGAPVAAATASALRKKHAALAKKVARKSGKETTKAADTTAAVAEEEEAEAASPPAADDEMVDA